MWRYDWRNSNNITRESAMNNPMAPASTTPLLLTIRRQAVWSKTANSLKHTYATARSWTFVFTILGALLAMIASQLPEGRPRLYLAGVSTVLFAMVSFISARMLGGDRATAWTRSRAASEALKRAAYRYLAKAAPYEGPDRETLLNSERQKIEEDVTDLKGQATEDSDSATIAGTDLLPQEYIDKRVEGQIKWFRPKAQQAQRKARSFRRTEFILAAVTAFITA